jgi:hypothetical protein
MHALTLKYVGTHMHTHSHTHKHTHACTNSQTRLHTHYTHTFTHTNTHTCTHIDPQVGFKRELIKEVKAFVVDAQYFRRDWEMNGPMVPNLGEQSCICV